MKKILSIMLAVVLVFGVSIGASASSVQDYGIFTGYGLTISDYTTPATTLYGRPNDPNYMCFRAADGRELGAMLYSDYLAVSNKHQIIVQLEGGSTQGVPPSGGSWEAWFADEFNKIRGLSTGSREAAQAAYLAQTTEEYRQELIRLINAEREKVGLHPYIIDETCMEYSQMRSGEIVDLFSHTRPDGTDAGYEVIFRGHSPSEAVNWWMNSDGHRAAILHDTRKFIGVGVTQTTEYWFFCQAYFERDPEVYANTKMFG